MVKVVESKGSKKLEQSSGSWLTFTTWRQWEYEKKEGKGISCRFSKFEDASNSRQDSHAGWRSNYQMKMRRNTKAWHMGQNNWCIWCIGVIVLTVWTLTVWTDWHQQIRRSSQYNDKQLEEEVKSSQDLDRHLSSRLKNRTLWFGRPDQWDLPVKFFGLLNFIPKTRK